MRQSVNGTKRGDTMIEVMLSITIFSVIAVLSVNLMNNGLNTAQSTLEYEMARNEIDAQAEALRLIHDGYVAERQVNKEESQFVKLWKKFTENASNNSDIDKNESSGNGKSFDINKMSSCEAAYGEEKHLSLYNSFIVNTRLVLPDFSKTNNSNFKYLGRTYQSIIDDMIVFYKDPERAKKFRAAPLYPRIIYKKLTGSDTNENANLNEGGNASFYNEVSVAEGIWVDALGNGTGAKRTRSDYYDFYIRTCWHSVGSPAPSTITTVVRLYNPEVME